MYYSVNSITSKLLKWIRNLCRNNVEHIEALNLDEPLPLAGAINGWSISSLLVPMKGLFFREGEGCTAMISIMI